MVATCVGKGSVISRFCVSTKRITRVCDRFLAKASEIVETGEPHEQEGGRFPGRRGKTFTDKFSMNAHETSHCGESQHVCQKRFAHSGSLNAHVRSSVSSAALSRRNFYQIFCRILFVFSEQMCRFFPLTLPVFLLNVRCVNIF